MIRLEETFDTIDEMKAFFAEETPQNIYDDVEVLQGQMSEVLNSLVALSEKTLFKNAVDLTGKDLNDQIGSIIIGYGNNCSNKPGTQNGYLINIPHHSAPERYGKQIWIARPSNNIFVRNLDDSVWSDWVYIYYDSRWNSLPLASGVIPQNATVYPCRVRRLSNTVYVEGAVKGFSEVTKVVATLPEGFRPAMSFYTQNVTSAGQTDTYRVYTDGKIERIATTRSPQSVDDYHFLNMSFLVN